jgi:hypothetical protein
MVSLDSEDSPSGYCPVTGLRYLTVQRATWPTSLRMEGLSGRGYPIAKQRCRLGWRVVHRTAAMSYDFPAGDGNHVC